MQELKPLSLKLSIKALGLLEQIIIQFNFLLAYSRSSRPEVFLEKGVLKICNKFAGEQICNFIEIALRHGRSPVNLQHIFRTPFPRNTSEWLLLILLTPHRNLNIFHHETSISSKNRKQTIKVCLESIYHKSI